MLNAYEKYTADDGEKHAIFGFIASLLTMEIAKEMLEKKRAL